MGLAEMVINTGVWSEQVAGPGVKEDIVENPGVVCGYVVKG